MKKNFLFLTLLASLMFIFAATGQGAPPYTLTVTKTGTGTGVVTSSPAGIKCGDDCSEVVTKEGKRFTLKAKPAANSYFAGWTDSCTGSMLTTCKIVMSADVTATAAFQLKQADMEFSSDTLDFGTVETGDKETQVFQISNKGTGDLYVALSGLEDDFSFVGKSTAKIKPKGSYKFKIRYKAPTEITGSAQPESSTEAGSAGPAIDAPSVKIINFPMKVTSNDPKKPSVEVPVLADLVVKTKYGFKIDSNIKFKVQSHVDITYKEKGEIPFNLVSHARPGYEPTKYVDCTPGGDNPDPSYWACTGNSTFTATGTLQGENGDCPTCTVNGSGTYDYKLEGRDAGGNLSADLSITDIKQEWIVCCGKCGCAAREIPYFAAIYNKSSKFNPEVPLRPGGKQTKPIDLYTYTGSIIWSIIYK